MKIQFSDHFTCSKLLLFTLPSMAMMVLTSIYSVVDGLYVSNLVGDAALAAVNIVSPLPMALGAFGVMLGTGGSGEVARALGLGNGQKAKEYFSSLILTTLILGLVLSGLGVLFIRPLCTLLGADKALLELCAAYGTITVSGGGAFMLQTVFQSFCIVAGRPELGFSLSLAAGVANMALDGLFIAGLGWGVKGAALATLCGYLVGSAIPLIYFLRDNGTPLRLVLPRMDRQMLSRACCNGFSELMSNLSASLATILYNRCLMNFIGEPGVAAYTVMMYVQYVSSAILIGFSMGSAPLFTFQYGAGNVREFKNLFRKGLITVCALSAGLTLLSQLLATPLARIFVGYNEALLTMTVTGFRRFALSFLLCGVSIFASALFTALGDSTASAVISFLRALAFQCGAILLLPALMGLSGVWWCAVLAEGMALAVSAAMLFLKRKRYKFI